ncbi:neogenin-like isoform X1 [Pantherophis guttatus]|uniref:Neogenin-like isoform X1 n=1 Tax=Pantherophis guttatus TaxID=94885 RepID=A0A6P9CHY4_PANGU|nr:neogenin-like isoform X1 [Pantherophis guttatus]
MGAEHFLIFIFAAGAVQGAKESLEIIPINGNVELNTQAYFLCKVRGGGGVQVSLTWIDPEGNEIEEDSKPYWVKVIDETSKGLEMTLTSPDQGGNFKCVGEFDFEKTVTNQIEIHVIQRPTFVNTMDLVKEVHEGQNVEFSCLVKGIPTPTIRWIFGNQDIRNIKERQLFVENGKLLIENTQSSDAGIYICEATIEERNEVAFANFTLNIKFAPKIELLTSVPLVTQTGNPIQVNFTILANPSPSVSIAWKEKIFEDDAIKMIAQNQNRYLFLFEITPTSQEDIPELVITAANEVGTTKKNVPLEKDGGLGWGSILAIVLAILVLLLLIDALCYYKRRCGFLMFCKKNILCKRSTTGVENNGKILSKSGKSPVVNISGSEA